MCVDRGTARYTHADTQQQQLLLQQYAVYTRVRTACIGMHGMWTHAWTGMYDYEPA
jgi:hypothetical protein